MKRFWRLVSRMVLYVAGFVFLVVLSGFAWVLLGFNDETDGRYSFDPSSIPQDVDVYLATQEAEVPNLRPGEQKRIVWSGDVGEKTDIAIVYLHGFSASPVEIRPVPEQVAEALGANLFFTRFSGHGRDSDAMAEPRGSDWLANAAEAMEIGRRLGERVVIVSTSTGGTLATAVAADALMSKDLVGVVLISPNYKISNPMARLLTWPMVRLWGPIVAGEYREFEPDNEAHGRHWTTRYPMVATVSLALLVSYVSKLDFEAISQPALVIFSDDDQVVSPLATQSVIDRWGGEVEVEKVTVTDGVDPEGHSLVGDIQSPAMTEWAVTRITRWIKGL